MIFFVRLLTLFYFHLIILSWCEAEIKLIQATIRHAARNPADSTDLHFYYPNDPYKDRDWRPEGPLKLTIAGQRDAFDFGVFLQNKYPPLKESNRSFINFYAINMSRTLDTARLIATGIFSFHVQSWYIGLLLIPIDVKLIETDLNFPMLFCENYNYDRRQANIDIRRVLKVLSDIQDLFSYLSDHTGVNYTFVTQGWLLYHQLASQAGLGLELESWTNLVFPNGKLVDISAIEYILQTYTTRMKRLMGGVWIKAFLDHVDQLLTNRTNLQMKGFFYICTEMQIAAILNTLGVYKAHVPGYLSTIIFELHEIDNDYYVKVIYKDLKMKDLTIPGCEKSLCLLSRFRYILNQVTLNNFHEDCGRRGYFPIIGNNFR